MFNMKKWISFTLAIMIIFSLSTVAFATKELQFNINGESVSMGEIAEKSNLNASELEKYYIESPSEFLLQVNELYSEDKGALFTGNTSGEAAGSLSDLVSLGKKGDIIISATNTSKVAEIINYRHGHAAIVYDNENIIQAIGPGLKSKKSTLSGFGEVEKVRLYQVSTATKAKATNASNYAAKSLINKDYDIDASAASTTSVNCATLVWQAYKNQNISLKKYFYTVTPASLTEDTKTDAIGNINWTGDEDSFDI